MKLLNITEVWCKQPLPQTPFILITNDLILFTIEVFLKIVKQFHLNTCVAALLSCKIVCVLCSWSVSSKHFPPSFHSCSSLLQCVVFLYFCTVSVDSVVCRQCLFVTGIRVAKLLIIVLNAELSSLLLILMVFSYVKGVV